MMSVCLCHIYVVHMRRFFVFFMFICPCASVRLTPNIQLLCPPNIFLHFIVKALLYSKIFTVFK